MRSALPTTSFSQVVEFSHRSREDCCDCRDQLGDGGKQLFQSYWRVGCSWCGSLWWTGMPGLRWKRVRMSITQYCLSANESVLLSIFLSAALLSRQRTKCGRQSRNAGSSEISQHSTRMLSSKASQRLQSKRHRQKSSLLCGVISNRCNCLFTGTASNVALYRQL